MNAVGLSGSPESGARLYAYVKETSSPYPVYLDSGLATPAENPHITNALGLVQVYLNDARDYTLRLKTSNDATTLFEANYTANTGLFTIVSATIPNYNSFNQALMAFGEGLMDAIEQVADPTLIAWGNLAFTATDNLGYATGVDTFALLATKAAGRSVLTLDDPNADRIVFFDDSEGTAAYLTVGTGLAITTTTLAVSANLQLYSAITPSANVQSFLGAADYAAMRTQLSLGALATVTPGTGVATALAIAIGSAGAVVTSNSTDTLSNKTIASPTLSGTVAGAPTYSGNQTIAKASPRIVLNDTSGAAETALQMQSNGTNKWLLGKGAASGGQDFEFYNYGLAGYPLIMKDATGELIGMSVGPTSVYSLGYRGTPQNIQNGSYTFVLADAGKQVHAFSATCNYTIPPNSSVAFPIGTVIQILSTGATISVLEGSGVFLNRGDGTSGSGTRTVGPNSMAAITKSDTNTWIISGAFT